MDTHDQNRPFRIGFLLIDGFALMSYAAASEPLRAANLLAGRRLYDVQNIPASGARAVSSGGASVDATARMDGLLACDLLLVVAGGEPIGFHNPAVFAWLRRMARQQTRLGGVSGGPVILAMAGLMAGRRMTVHWEHAEGLSRHDPALLIERGIYVMDRDRLTCGGGLAATDMMHALIAEHHGTQFAQRISNWFLHTDIRASAAPQPLDMLAADPNLAAAMELIRNHVADPLSLPQLARTTGMSPRQLSRLFRRHLGVSPMAFCRKTRLDTARQLIDTTAMALTDIALATGFADSAHFSSAFRKAHGIAPSHLRRMTRLDPLK